MKIFVGKILLSRGVKNIKVWLQLWTGFRFVDAEFVIRCDELVIRFFPFALWLPAIWRRKFPHHRPIF